jgi:outer membrane protein OmpA-like peptidoglycan-associated protein
MKHKIVILALLFACHYAGMGQNFRVQIAAYADSMPARFFKDKGVERYVSSCDQMGIYHYYAGSYHTMDEADKIKDRMVMQGFPYATVIDLEEQRILCGTGCPYYRNGVVFVKDTARQKTVRNIFFDSGQSGLSTKAKEILDEMAQLLKENQGYKLTLKGYTDAVGDPKSNIEMASVRSRAARNYLIAKGIRADRMFIKVYGEAEPLAPNKDDEGKDSSENMALNRRVMLEVIK